MEIPVKRVRLSILSFTDEEDQEPLPIKRFQKNPEISSQSTGEQLKYEEIKKNYDKEQLLEGQEEISLTFAYWDGTNIKHSLTVRKNCSISDFIKQAKVVLVKDFPHLEASTNLMYVKKDLIIPLDYTFHDLLISKHKDLFKLEATNGGWIDSGYTAKILERKWYEKNKHIFPACKWKLFEP